VQAIASCLNHWHTASDKREKEKAMAFDVNQRRSGCPISSSLDLLGDKWSLLIVRDMVFVGKRYFKEFLSSDEGIATNILTDRLNRLDLIGIISKQQDPENGRQIVYTLTEKGVGLIPLLVELVCWGAIYDGAPNVDPDALKRIQRDKPGFIRKLEKDCGHQGAQCSQL